MHEMENLHGIFFIAYQCKLLPPRHFRNVGAACWNECTEQCTECLLDRHFTALLIPSSDVSSTQAAHWRN